MASEDFLMGLLKDFCRVVTGLRREKPTSLTRKLCPRCGSSKLRFSAGFDTYPRLYGLVPGHYVCEHCGYAGPLVLEVDEEGDSSPVSGG